MRKEIKDILNDFEKSHSLDESIGALKRLRDEVTESDLRPDFNLEDLKQFCCEPVMEPYCDFCGRTNIFKYLRFLASRLGWKLRRAWEKAHKKKD